jgi:osmotically-inducible protein OsmY
MRTIGRARMILSSICLLAFLAAAPAAIAAGAIGTPAAPGSTRQTWDDIFKQPATRQDTTLAQLVKARLTRTTGGPDDGEWRSVGVDARNGHLRLTGKGLTAEQRASVENIVRNTAGVKSWDWGAQPR